MSSHEAHASLAPASSPQAIDRPQLAQQLAEAMLAMNRARSADIRELKRGYEGARTAYAACLQRMHALPPLSDDEQVIELWNGLDRIAAWLESVAPVVRDFDASSPSG